MLRYFMVAALSVIACTPATQASPAAQVTPAASAPASPQPTLSAVVPESATATARPSPSATAMALDQAVGCYAEKPCRLQPGTHVTTGEFGFIPGLTFTVPSGWFSPYHSAGELALERSDVRHGIYIGRGAVPVPGHRGLAVATDGTAAGLAEWISRHPDLVISEPEQTTIGAGIDAVTVLVSVAADAETDDPDCPTRACVDFITDPVHADFPFGIPAGEVARLYLADIGDARSPNVLMVNVWSPTDSDLARLEILAQPILDSLILPVVIINN